MYSLNYHEAIEIEKAIKELLEMEHIRSSKSSFFDCFVEEGWNHVHWGWLQDFAQEEN